jgi:diguanylate cyclase (GGDEF)-like protein
VRLLRSWLKQEQQAAQKSRLILNLRAAVLLLALLVGLEALRRYQSTRQQLTRQQDEQLQTLQALVRDNKRPLTDWAAWDEVLAFSEGRQPDFVERLMRTTALLDGGAVMAIHDGVGRQLALEGVDRRERSGASLLVRCLDQVSQERLRQAVDQLPVVCPSVSGPLVGGSAVITDTSGERRSTASLTYLVPLLSPTDGSPQQSGLRDLVDELVFDGNGSSARQSQLRTVQPPLWTGTGRPLQVRGPRLDQSLREEWLALGGLVIGGLLLILGQRMRWMLQKRRLRLEKIRRERLVNQRFRHTERELSRLLDQVQLGGDGTETMAFARLLKKHDTDPAAVTAEDRRLERLAVRFEQVLQTARTLALFDAVTGLPNRNYFLERLHWDSERSSRGGKPLALLFINIDKFKQINETYGHNTGDSTLRFVAEELQRLVKGDDFLARFGGDEFSLILDTESLGQCDGAAIRSHAHGRALELLEGFRHQASSQPERIKLSLSIGIAISDPSGTTAEELIRRSDMAMVMAKSARQQNISIFDIETDWDALNNYRLFNALQSDISHAPERFHILFQPIVDAAGRLLKVEALARWSNAEFPDVLPDVFFALAERYRLMPELGRLLLAITLRELKLLRENLDQPKLPLALNISASQLGQGGFGPQLLADLSEQHIAAEEVTLEITESAVVEASPELSENLQSLRRAGVKLSLDDFGTGFSSLRLLMWLKPDELKIDKSFVLAAAEDPIARQIVRLLHTLSRDMKLTLVAEGVEAEAMFQLLREAGVEHFQGHLFSRPLSREKLAAVPGPNFPPRSSPSSE